MRRGDGGVAGEARRAGRPVKSIGAKIKQLDGMADTKDLSVRESDFVASVVARTNCGADTRRLTGPQIDWIEGLYKRHFGDG